MNRILTRTTLGAASLLGSLLLLTGCTTGGTMPTPAPTVASSPNTSSGASAAPKPTSSGTTGPVKITPAPVASAGQTGARCTTVTTSLLRSVNQNNVNEVTFSYANTGKATCYVSGKPKLYSTRLVKGKTAFALIKTEAAGSAAPYTLNTNQQAYFTLRVRPAAGCSGTFQTHVLSLGKDPNKFTDQVSLPTDATICADGSNVRVSALTNTPVA